MVGRFLVEGALLGERVIYAGPEADVRAALMDISSADGFPADRAAGVEIVPASTLAPPFASADAGAGWLARASRLALGDGFTGLRVAMDASDLTTCDQAVEHGIAREAFLDRAVATHPVSLLCGYHRRRVPRLSALACLHPLTNLSGPAAAAGLIFADYGWALTGEIDLAVSGDIRTALLAIAEHTEDDLDLDCSAVTFLSVSGVEMLVAVAGRIGPKRRLVVHNPPSAVRRVLSIGWPEGIPQLTLD